MVGVELHKSNVKSHKN